ncbi:MAG: hypothetical protein WBA09_22525 [Candidatus Acidiferrum sp.]
MTQAQLLGKEIAVVGDAFSLEYIIEVLKIDKEQLATVFNSAQNADDFAFFLHTGFALGRLYERYRASIPN